MTFAGFICGCFVGSIVTVLGLGLFTVTDEEDEE